MKASPLPPPQQMSAAQGSGTSCNKPDWSCISENTMALPSPATGQVLIEVHGSSANPVNADLVEPGCEKLVAFGGCTKGTLGNEGAGIVVTVGAGCANLKKGDEVWGSIQASYAQ